MKRKRILCLILCLMLLLSACGKDKSEGQDVTKSTDSENLNADGLSATVDIRYNESYYPFPGGYTVCDVARVENCLLFLGQRQSQEIEIDGAVFYGADLALAEYMVTDSGRIAVSEAKIITGGGADDIILCVTAGGDGYFYALSKNTDGTYSVTRYSADGEAAGVMALELPSESIDDIYVTSSGVIALNDWFSVYLAQWQQGLEAAIDIPVDSHFRGGSVNGDSVILPTMRGIFELDALTGELKDSGIKDSDEDSGTGYIGDYTCQGLSGELLFNPGSMVYEYDPNSNGWSMLFRFKSGMGYGPACRLGESSFVMATNSEAALFTGVERVPYDAEKGRSVVKVAYLGVGDYIETACIDLVEYEYQGTSYAGAEYEPDFRQDVERFRVSMMAGEVPDLIIFQGDCLDTGSNFFEDLLPYIDRDLSRDDFLPNFLDAFSVRGELHTVSSEVSIQCVFARQADVGSGIGLTPAYYTDILNSSGKYEILFEQYISANSFLSNGIADMAASIFTDRESGTANFDAPAFGELLAWCRELGDEPKDGDPNYVYIPLSETLLKMEHFANPGRIDVIREYFGDPVVPVGLPDGADGFNYFIPSGVSFAIPAGSQNKEGAWAYIKEVLSRDNQLALSPYADLPVNYEALKRRAEASLSETGLQLMDELLERTKYASTYSDQGLRDIIVSGAQGYIAGGRTLEDTVDIIQSKASIYMAEKYG